MKLLLDENLPVRLKYRFSSELTVSTVSDEGWNAKKDGELLQLMQKNGFTVLVTSDRNLAYQQSLESFGVVVLVLIASDNRYNTLKEYVPLIEKKLPPTIKFGVIEIGSKK